MFIQSMSCKSGVTHLCAWFLCVGVALSGGVDREPSTSSPVIKNNAATPTSATTTGGDEKLTKEVEDALHDVFSESGDTTGVSEKCYTLGGIIFQQAAKWTVFLNEHVFTNKTVSPDFSIIEVEAHRILIQSKFNEKDEAKWLSINQTFCPRTGDVQTHVDASESPSDDSSS